ncbi:unnamed protein product [Caenorhabditis auriculariae]|uniref:Uncharacterized protein n=1 Tax=Caenorhabditis auriculariae TaxID=2777116 RepID=A0A8S1GR52_9PELO|nr:unnamed protein product [Caenorhabditis auriculariae]
MWRKSIILICLTFILSGSLISAQSIDEEESVHVGGKEGSGSPLPDDEDVEGSSLPPDTYYATTPSVRSKFGTTTVGKVKNSEESLELTTEARPTTTVLKQKVTTFATSTPRITTRVLLESSIGNSRTAPAPATTSFSTIAIVIVLGAIIFLLALLIIVIMCCKAYNNRKQAYRPGKRETPEALLKE